MPNYWDINLANTQLSEQAQALGWHDALTAKVVSVKRPQDLPKERDGVIVVEGENTDLLRQACKRAGVTLVNPTKVHQYFRDDGLIRAVAQNDKAFEIPISELLRSSFVYRARHLVTMRSFLARCVRLKAGFVLTSRAQESWDLKSPRETVALGVALGLTPQQAEYAITKRVERLLSARESE